MLARVPFGMLMMLGETADRLGYPVIIKAVSGGGGRGDAYCTQEE